MNRCPCHESQAPWNRQRIDPLQGLRDELESAAIAADELAKKYVSATGKEKVAIRERLIEASNALADLDLELLIAERRVAA